MKRCETCEKTIAEGERYCTRCGEKQKALSGSVPKGSAKGGGGETRVYKADNARPVSSEPVRFAVLVRVLEEGAPPQESWLKPGPFVIGRNQGDWVFPDDGLLSGRHAALEVAVADPPPKGEQSPWAITVQDLSKNGTYLRARKPVKITDGLCVLIGNTFLEWTVLEGASAAVAGKAGHTVEMRRGKAAPALFKVAVSGPEGSKTVPVSGPATLGSRESEIVLDDPCVSDFHAELVSKGDAYYLEDRDSLNGVFTNVGKDKTALSAGDELRMGGQLFRLESRSR